MVSIINRTEEDQTKIIDKGAKSKFKWSWLEKFVTVEIEKKSHKIIRHVKLPPIGGFQTFLSGSGSIL